MLNQFEKYEIKYFPFLKNCYTKKLFFLLTLVFTKYIMKKSLTLLALLSFFAINLYGSSQKITTKDFWVRLVPTVSKVSAAYGEIYNTSSKDDFLLNTKCNISKKTEVHLSKQEDGVTKMIHQKSVKIPAKSSLILKRGSYHIMFMGLQKKLVEGKLISCTLYFKNAGELSLDIPIKKQ